MASTKTVIGLGKNLLRPISSSSRSNVQCLTRRLKANRIHTNSSQSSAYTKTSLDHNKHLVLAGGLLGSVSAFAFSTTFKHPATDDDAPVSPLKDPTIASTLPLDQVPTYSYDTTEANLRAAFEELKDLLGTENVSLKVGERVAHSGSEWSPAPRGEQDKPSMIVYPRSTEDVSGIAKICHRRRIPMIAFSGGTSLESTLAAQNQEICLDFNRHMNKILKIRKEDMDITLQPSVGYEQLNEILAKDGMFFPPDPGPGAQIGGMIAQGCSGTNAFRYGTMKDWVLGLTVVLAGSYTAAKPW